MSDNYKPRENSGLLFRNDRKQSESAPDYRGVINVGGSEFEIAGWIKQGQKSKFMSLAVKRKDAERKPAMNDFHTDDIPF